jgi:hypothetical protein
MAVAAAPVVAAWSLLVPVPVSIMAVITLRVVTSATIIVAPIGGAAVVRTLTILTLILLATIRPGAEAIVLLTLPIGLLAALVVKLLTLIGLLPEAVALLALLIGLPAVLAVELPALVLLRAEAVALLALLIGLLATLLVKLTRLLIGLLSALFEPGALIGLLAALLELGTLLLLRSGLRTLLLPLLAPRPAILLTLAVELSRLLRPAGAAGNRRRCVKSKRAQCQGRRQTESDNRSVHAHLGCLLSDRHVSPA